jgi:hypothetical protein
MTPAETLMVGAGREARRVASAMARAAKSR